MVTSFGMSEDMNFVPFLLDDYGNIKYSKNTQKNIDNAVNNIIKE